VLQRNLVGVTKRWRMGLEHAPEGCAHASAAVVGSTPRVTIAVPRVTQRDDFAARPTS
jgi:hypothetical protein